MTSADASDDTVVPPQGAAAPDDTIVSKRARALPVDAAIGDAVRPPAPDETTDATALSARRKGSAGSAPDASAADGGVDREDRKSPARQAYAPDADALRSAEPVRAAGPVHAARRAGAARREQRRLDDTVDGDSLHRLARARARRRLLGLLTACAAAAAAAGSILLLLLPW